MHGKTVIKFTVFVRGIDLLCLFSGVGFCLGYSCIIILNTLFPHGNQFME